MTDANDPARGEPGDALTAAIAHLRASIALQGRPYSSAPTPVVVYEHSLGVVLEALAAATARAEAAEQRLARVKWAIVDELERIENLVETRSEWAEGAHETAITLLNALNGVSERDASTSGDEGDS